MLRPRGKWGNLWDFARGWFGARGRSTTGAEAENVKGFQDWADFLVKTRGYAAGDARIGRQFQFLQMFLQCLPQGGAVLEVGSGRRPMRRFFEGFRYVSVATAIGDAPRGDPGWDVISDGRQLPFPTGGLDGAVTLWGAEPMRDPLATVGEMARVLKPGGHLMMFVPFDLNERHLSYAGYRFTRFGTSALLHDAGLGEIAVVPDSPVGFAVANEGIRHLKMMSRASILPPRWKKEIESCRGVFELLAKNFAPPKAQPGAAPGFSFLALGRKPADGDAAQALSPRPSRTLPVERETMVPGGAGRRLNVGCGHQKMPGWIGIDRVKTAATDIVRDITRGLPFDDSSVEEIYCDNVLEHIGPSEDFIFVLNEFYRVLKPGCIATVIVPDGRSQGAWQDPTHQRAFVPRSALYWNQDLPWPKLYGITANFDVQVQAYGDRETEAYLKFTCRAREHPRSHQPYAGPEPE